MPFKHDRNAAIDQQCICNLSFLGTHGDKVAAAAALPAGPVNELMRASFMLN